MYYLFVLGRALAQSMPRDLCYLIARMLGSCQYYFFKKDRLAVLYNLAALITDTAKRKRCARETFINFAYYLVDFFRYEKIDKEFFSRYVRVSGQEFLDECVNKGRGIIGVSAHLGNYEFGATIVANLGYSIYAVALVHKDKRLNDFFDRQRNLTGVNVIPTGVFAKQCVRVLEENKFVVFLGDRDFGNSGVTFPLCGRLANLPRGPAFFALKTGASVLPVFCIRENKKFYHLIFEKPIHVDQGLQAERELMARYSKILETYIAKYPEQWYLFEKYWVD
jgi:Kdo2-lipid IVA lauroyltransferase/acyltransferase